MDTAVGFFIFNRLDTTKEVFEQIRIAKPSRLYLISDGPRKTREGEAETVAEVRGYVESHIDWDCKVTKNYADSNMGCKKRMASGITWLLQNEEQAIILEDDCKPTQDFFRFMEEMLDKYKDDERVMMVSGYMLLKHVHIKDSYTFSEFATIWGWATWRRAWDHYDIRISDWEQVKKRGELKRKFTTLGYIKAVKDFDSVYYNRKDTWDIQWFYTLVKERGLNIVPAVNMVENLGFGREDATHTTGETDQDFTTHPMEFPLRHPETVALDEAYDRAYDRENWGLYVVLKRKIVGLFGKNEDPYPAHLL